MLAMHREQQDAARGDAGTAVVQVQADDLIGFRALRVRDENSKTEDEFELGISLATGGNNSGKAEGTKLSKVYQLSGFSDPVYAEAYVNVHQYDIMLDGTKAIPLPNLSLPESPKRSQSVTRLLQP